MKIQVKGLDKTLSKLKAFSNIDDTAGKVFDKLADIGAKEVRQAHDGVMGTDTIITQYGTFVEQVESDAVVTVEKEGSKTSIVARGEQMAFFEFGAGVAKNSPRKWNNVLDIPIPSDIKPIGAYGGGRGLQPKWHYRKDDMLISTEGYAARHGFANAINAIMANKEKIVKEVLNEQSK